MADVPFFPAIAAAEPQPPPRRPRRGTCSSSSPESKFWQSFKNSQLSSGLIHPISHLEFSPSAPHDLAASVSTNVNLYGGHSSPDLSPKSFSPLRHFEDVAYSPSFRCDGALLAAASQSGLIQIFDPNRARLPLRSLRGHNRPVRVVRYPRISDKVHLFSGGDDAVLNYWDAATESKILSFQSAHKDYIRAGCASPLSSDLFATGSYDHTLKLWDVRAPENSVMDIIHGDPIESVVFLPSGGLMASSGGNVVKIWDVIGGGRIIHRLECHNKTVTSLCLGGVQVGDEKEPRLISASLDGYVKIFDFAAFKITHSTRFPSMLVSAAFSPAGNVLVAGSSNGTIYIGRKKKNKEIAGVNVIERKALTPSNFRYFRRGQNEKPSATDIIIKKTRKVKLAEHDKLLKKFEHGRALISALEERNPRSVMAVMQELVARKKLVACVRGMDAQGLALLLSFLHKNATMPRYARFLMELAIRVIQMRAEEISSSLELRARARNVKRMVAEEIKVQHALQEIQGIVSPLLKIAGR